MTIKTSVFFLILFSLTGSAADKIYKWVDEQGNTHYSSEKPTNNKANEIQLKTTNKKDVSTAAPSVAEPSNKTKQLSNKEKLDAYLKKDQKLRAKAARKRKTCAKAKTRLKDYKNAMSYRKKDPNSGGYIYLNETKRQKKQRRYQKGIVRLQNNIKKACK